MLKIKVFLFTGLFSEFGGTSKNLPIPHSKDSDVCYLRVILSYCVLNDTVTWER